MSGATYRIDVHHRPDSTLGLTYNALVTRLSDDMPMESFWAGRPVDVVARAREWIRLQSVKQDTVTLYVGDDGQDAEAPHSVKVPDDMPVRTYTIRPDGGLDPESLRES